MHFNHFALVGEFQNCVSHEQRLHQDQRNRWKTQVKRQVKILLCCSGFVFAQSARDADIYATKFRFKWQ